MSEQDDAFVERATLQNKLATPEQMSQAKQAVILNGESLLDALFSEGIIQKNHYAGIQKALEKHKATQVTKSDPLDGSASMEFDAFAEKAILQNRLAQSIEIKAVKDHQTPGRTLVDSLLDEKVIGAPHAEAIKKAYRQQGKQVPESTTGPGSSVEMPTQAAAAPTPSAPAASAPSTPAVTAPPVGDDVSAFKSLDEYLAYARKMGASDLHINAEVPPTIRLNSALSPLNRPPFTPEETEALLLAVLNDEQKEQLNKEKALDFCYSPAGYGRFRACFLKQRLGYDGAFRIIDDKIPSFEELGIPEALMRLTEYHQGLVLITGPSGSGKSTTLAAMVEMVNQKRKDHIITIEDPVELVFDVKGCQINQREVLTNTMTFSAALRAALREDPDVIMIGELRDQETTGLAISASETGHLVFGTLHTTSASRTISRVLNVFPPDEQSQIRSMISESIRGIICQQLIPKKDGSGRALALEILINTNAAGNLIRENKLHQMPSIIQMGKKIGMKLMDNSIQELLDAGIISGDAAWTAADSKKLFAQHAPAIGGNID